MFVWVIFCSCIKSRALTICFARCFSMDSGMAPMLCVRLYKLPFAEQSCITETQPSGLFHWVECIFTKLSCAELGYATPLLKEQLCCQLAIQSISIYLTYTFAIGTSFTAYIFKVGACSIFFIVPDVDLNTPRVIIESRRKSCQRCPCFT